jgi:hypothetical protein
MARYKEEWTAYDHPIVIGYIDTEHALGRFLPVDSQEVAAWIADGNTPDPAYTAEEIAAAQAAEAAAEAAAFLTETECLLASYNDDIATLGRSSISSAKIKKLRRDRRRARKWAGRSIPSYTEPED